MWWVIWAIGAVVALFVWAVCAGAARLDDGLDDLLDEDIDIGGKNEA